MKEKNNFLKKIFSVTNRISNNNTCHKVIYILGIKLSFRNRKKELLGSTMLENKIISILNDKIEQQNKLLESFERKVHRHIDFTYRDIMVILQNEFNFVETPKIELLTNYPVAYQSNDHVVPHGTIRDNTRFPRFIKKCEMLFPQKNKLNFLDLGCSGGGMVLEAILKNHIAFGLEGSDISLLMQRAEWRLLKNNLFTCDITKPFELKSNDNFYIFDVITAWEVLEHLPEDSLRQFFDNLSKHMNEDSIFVCTVAGWNDIDPITKVNWHITVKPEAWWINIFEQYGFTCIQNLMDDIDFPRAAYNPPNCWDDPDTSNYLRNEYKAVNYKFVLKKGNN